MATERAEGAMAAAEGVMATGQSAAVAVADQGAVVVTAAACTVALMVAAAVEVAEAEARVVGRLAAKAAAVVVAQVMAVGGKEEMLCGSQQEWLGWKGNSASKSGGERHCQHLTRRAATSQPPFRVRLPQRAALRQRRAGG